MSYSASHAAHAANARSESTWNEKVDALDAIAEAKPIVSVDCEGISITVAPLGPSLGQREAQPVLDAAMAALSSRGDKKNHVLRLFVVDLSAVSMMSAYGLGLCCDLAKRARDAGMQPVLYGATREILDGLRLFKTDRLFKVVRGRDELVVLLHG